MQLMSAKKQTEKLRSMYRAAGADPKNPSPALPTGSSHATTTSTSFCASDSSFTSSASSSTTASSTPRRGSIAELEQQHDRLTSRLQDTQQRLQAQRRLANGLAEQLPVVQALGAGVTQASAPEFSTATATAPPPPAPSDKLMFAASGTTPNPKGCTAQLQQRVCDFAQGGRPPVAVLTLNPLQPPAFPGVKLLKCDRDWSHSSGSPQVLPGAKSVWLLESGGERFIAKVEPCHSAEATAAYEAGLRPSTGSGLEPVEPHPVSWAVREAVNAARINDQCAAAARARGRSESSAAACEPVLPPELVFVRDCSMLGSQGCMGHDKEVVYLYRFCEGGDAYKWLSSVVDVAVRDCGSSPEGLAAATEGVVREVYRMTTDVVEAMEAVHDQGWVLADFKPENTVRCHERGRMVLIDVAGASLLRGIPDGWLDGSSTYTPEYAAPEQMDYHAPRRGLPSDVFAAGMFVRELLMSAMKRMGRAAEAAVTEAAVRMGLHTFVGVCTEEDPAERPTMAMLREALGA